VLTSAHGLARIGHYYPGGLVGKKAQSAFIELITRIEMARMQFESSIEKELARANLFAAYTK
jgi:hypothetical protein